MRSKPPLTDCTSKALSGAKYHASARLVSVDVALCAFEVGGADAFITNMRSRFPSSH